MVIYLTKNLYDRAIKVGMFTADNPGWASFEARFHVPNPTINWGIEQHTPKRGQTKKRCKRKKRSK